MPYPDLGVGHEAARVHHASRRRGGGVAANARAPAAFKNWAARYRPWCGFRRALHAEAVELGYVEGRNVVIERKSAGGNVDS